VNYREAVAQVFSFIVDGHYKYSFDTYLILIDYGKKVSYFLFCIKEVFKYIKSYEFFSFTSPTFPKLIKPAKGRRRELTEEENDEIKEAFELFDNDKDNELDYHEFKV